MWSLTKENVDKDIKEGVELLFLLQFCQIRLENVNTLRFLTVIQDIAIYLLKSGYQTLFAIIPVATLPRQVSAEQF